MTEDHVTAVGAALNKTSAEFSANNLSNFSEK